MSDYISDRIEWWEEIPDKVTFGKELKRRVLARKSVESIGNWVYSVYFHVINACDLEFRDILLTLSAMSSDPCMEWSYEALEVFADDLIGEGVVIETRKDFALELKRRALGRQKIAIIENWVTLVYERLENREDEEFLKVLEALRSLWVSPAVGYSRYSYEELEKIADDLITGKEVKL